HGYIVALRQGLVAAVAQATRELGSQLVGMHVLEVEAAWERLAGVGDWVGPGGLLHDPIAPLGIALWDAAGKTLGPPFDRLLAGRGGTGGGWGGGGIPWRLGSGCQ